MSSFSLPSRRLTVVPVASPFAAPRLLLESGADPSLTKSGSSFWARLKSAAAPAASPFSFFSDRAIVVGTCVIGFEFDGARIISNCAITILILRPGVAAIVVSGRICGAEFDCFGVVGNGASRVILQPFGLSTVIIWRVIFWIEFGRAIEISYGTIQVTVLRFFDPAINEIAVGARPTPQEQAVISPPVSHRIPRCN